MSEIEPSPEPLKAEAVNVTSAIEPSASKSIQETNSSLNNSPAPSNSALASPATVHAAPNPVKRFGSADINKKFLQKTSSVLINSSSPTGTANNSPTPAPTKAAPSPGSRPSSTSNAPRLVTTKLTQTPSSSASKCSRDASGEAKKSGAAGSDNATNRSGLSTSKGLNKDRTSSSPGRTAWGSVLTPLKANARVQSDFPTAAEIKDRTDKAAATAAAQRRSLDAFRGVHLDPKAQHWDEMTEEDSDFLTGVIEFGDGKQYTVAPATEEGPTEARAPDSSEDRLGNDFDRTWPASKENGRISPSGSHKSSQHPERVLFNERHNRMEALPQTRPVQGTPTLLNPTPSSIRGGRRGSDGRAWNNSRGHQGDTADREMEGRGRRQSGTERDKLPNNQGGLGLYLKDRSPDGSGRFPGRNIPRRDSQASSGWVGTGPARSTRALSRESSDRGGGGGRQLPPHLAAASPVLPHSTTSSVAPRTSWRGSPTNARSPSSVFATARPTSILSDGSHHPPASEHEGAISPIDSTNAPQSEAAIVAALVQDETALKSAMAIAAERARKRRQEEEEERERQRERAKAKLLELEKKLQTEKDLKENEEREQERAKKEVEELEARLKAEKEAVEREAVKETKDKTSGPFVKDRVPPPPRPGRPQMPSDTAESWRTSRLPAVARAPSEHTAQQDLRKLPSILPKGRQSDPQTAAPVVNITKSTSVDLSGKPANASVIHEVAALHSKGTNDHIEVLDFADLHQLAEGYQNKLQSQGHGLSVTTVTNGVETSPSLRPVVRLKPAAGDDSKVSTKTESKFSRAQPPAPLNLPPRGSQDQHAHGPHSATHAPGSAGLGSARSPRIWDPSHPQYREAPISVLDDTMARFKQALMGSNPQHAGMSSDDIMEGLAMAEVGKSPSSQVATVQVRIALMLSKDPDAITSAPSWSQTQVVDLEEIDMPSVLIPTLSHNRRPIPQQKLQIMKHVEPWRWDVLTFDPPVPSMSRRTLSVMDALVEPSAVLPGRLRIKLPGGVTRTVPYTETSRLPTASNARTRKDERITVPAPLQPTINGMSVPPKSAPLNSQWPPKSRGADEPVWRRAVPVTAIPEQAPVVAPVSDAPSTPLTSKSVPGAVHNRTLSIPVTNSPARTPPTNVNSIINNTWGRSPLSLTVTEDLPDDPSLKAAWNKASSNTDAKATKNSLVGIADDPPPHIPSSISELRSDDGDSAKVAEKDPSPPARLKYNPHKAFQVVSSQPPAPLAASPVVVPLSLSSTQPTPRTNALALTTNRTPRLPPPSLPPVSQGPPPFPQPTPQNNMPNAARQQGFPVPYPSPMVAYQQPMMAPQYAPSTPVMGPPTPSMMHRSSTPGLQMPPPMQNPGMWGQQPMPTPPNQMGYGRPMQAPMQTPMMPQMGYQPQMPPPQMMGQSLQLYMSPSPGVIHPPSPGISPLSGPGMGKPIPQVQRQNSLPMPGGAPSPASALPVSMPVTFQVGHPPPPPPQQQMGYMMAGGMPPPGTPQQQLPPQMRLPPQQGRGIPMHTPQYPQPAPNGYHRPW